MAREILSAGGVRWSLRICAWRRRMRILPGDQPDDRLFPLVI